MTGYHRIRRYLPRRQLWPVAFLLTAALAIFASSALSAGNRTAKIARKGGTLRIDTRADFDFIDPSLAYSTGSWQMLEAVCENLYRYPDAEGNAGVRPVPGTAAGFPRFSNGGKTVRIAVKRNFAFFHTGQAITAKSYAVAMQRDLDPKMQSAASSYMHDINGAEAVLDGKTSSAAGIAVNGNTLTLQLTKPVPDIVNRLAMPFFCPQPGNGLPRNPDGIGAPYSGGGPYYMKQWTPNRLAVLERNPYFKGPIAKTRPANVDRIQYTEGVSPAATKLRLDKNEADLGFIPPTAWSEVADQYPVNQGRFFLRKQMSVWYLAMNHDRPLFGPPGAGNIPLLKAVNWAIDRPSLAREYGYLAGVRTDQIIPYTMPGFRNWDIYSLRGANVAKARALAKGNTRSGHLVLYTWSTIFGPAIGQIVEQNLKAIGLEVEIKTFDPAVLGQKVGTRGEPFDMDLEGWAADYADPDTFFNTLFWGGSIHDTNSVNTSYVNAPALNKEILRVAALFGKARFTDYQNLDRVTMRDYAPIAPFINLNSRIYVGPDVGCFKFAPAHGVTNLAALCKTG
jgi:ABC-type oligopeptide transport system substrate-binding subunit